ncbi:MAG: large subunit ribosomal protein L35 [Rickettsiales bacterium]|jgi:large subunit ribosomal protein L35
MPKLKTNSSAKKRFKVTATGKIKYKHAGKRHGMTKRSNSQIRNLRKAGVLSESKTPVVLKYKMPYNR